MKHSLLTAAPLTVAAVLGTLPAGNAYGQFAPRGGHTEIPDSSIEQPQHIGVRAHTNYKMFMPAAGEMAKAMPLQASPQVGPPYSGYFFETPASLGCVYQLVSPIASGCNPNNVAAKSHWRQPCHRHCGCLPLSYSGGRSDHLLHTVWVRAA